MSRRLTEREIEAYRQLARAAAELERAQTIAERRRRARQIAESDKGRKEARPGRRASHA